MTVIDESSWRGTSDTTAAMRRRSQLTLDERWAWLVEAVDFAAECGTLTEVRRRRQRQIDRQWSDRSTPA